MNDPLTTPVVRYEFTRADGTTLVREWSLNDHPPKPPTDVPAFLVNPRRRWEHPQDPVTFLGDVRPGQEAEAEAWMAAQ